MKLSMIELPFLCLKSEDGEVLQQGPINERFERDSIRQ